VVVDYSPGDVWGLYLAPDHRVEAFVFHRGNSGLKPSLAAATWGVYKKVGPLLISTDRNGTGDGKPLHVWFTDFAVKLAGSCTWLNTE
jgi:hypothetical protein